MKLCWLFLQLQKHTKYQQIHIEIKVGQRKQNDPTNYYCVFVIGIHNKKTCTHFKKEARPSAMSISIHRRPRIVAKLNKKQKQKLDVVGIAYLMRLQILSLHGQCDIRECFGMQQLIEHRQQIALMIVPSQTESL